MTVIDQNTTKYYPFLWGTKDHLKTILLVNRDGSIEVDWDIVTQYCNANSIYDPVHTTPDEFYILCFVHSLLAMKNGKVTNLNAAN